MEHVLHFEIQQINLVWYKGEISLIPFFLLSVFWISIFSYIYIRLYISFDILFNVLKYPTFFLFFYISWYFSIFSHITFFRKIDEISFWDTFFRKVFSYLT